LLKGVVGDLSEVQISGAELTLMVAFSVYEVTIQNVSGEDVLITTKLLDLMVHGAINSGYTSGSFWYVSG
jgi:hypothetical protein